MLIIINTILMSVKERLTEYIHYKIISNTEFCRIIGVSNAFISSMRVSIQPDKLNSIALNFPDLNIGWLLTGEGEMLKVDTSKTKVDSGVSEMPDNHTETIPMIPFDAVAGYAGVDNAGVDISAYERYAIPEFKTIGAEFYNSIADVQWIDGKPDKKEQLRILTEAWNFLCIEDRILEDDFEDIEDMEEMDEDW